MKPIKIGDQVRPAADGETQSGQTLRWTRLRGVVKAVWDDCGEQRVEVRWSQKVRYATRMPAYLLETI